MIFRNSIGYSIRITLMALCLISGSLISGSIISSAQASETVSRQDAIQIVKSHYGGKVLKVKKVEGAYRVKLLTEGGRVKQILVDIKTGEIISREKHR